MNGKGDCYNRGGVGRGKKVGREVDLKEKKGNLSRKDCQ
jgi:hypothetical protein